MLHIKRLKLRMQYEWQLQRKILSAIWQGSWNYCISKLDGRILFSRRLRVWNYIGRLSE